jgi:membrane protein HdeD
VTDIVLERRRTGWDIVLGILVAIAGIVVLGHVVIATAISVLFLGWLALIAGVVELVSAFFKIKSGGFWSAALGGGLLTVLGILFLRNPEAAALTLTLVAGSLFFAGGITRIVAAFQVPEARWLLVLSGLVSVALGAFVLFNLVEATYTLLGVLLGVQALVEGITMAIAGRVRVAEVSSA